MPTSRITVTGDVGGVAVNSTITRSADGQIGHEVALAAAKSGTLSTRTSDTEGTLTLEAGHGVQTGDTVDVYWDGGRRYDVVVGTVSGNDVPISGGAGDVLPAQDDPVTAQVQQEIDTDFDGDLLVVIAALCGQRAHVGYFDGATLELSLDLVAAELWHWVNGGTAANPLASKTITHVVVTQASTSAATFRLGILYDSTA
jgi:hypothetical protein